MEQRIQELERRVALLEETVRPIRWPKNYTVYCFVITFPIEEQAIVVRADIHKERYEISVGPNKRVTDGKWKDAQEELLLDLIYQHQSSMWMMGVSASDLLVERPQQLLTFRQGEPQRIGAKKALLANVTLQSSSSLDPKLEKTIWCQAEKMIRENPNLLRESYGDK